jgi:hypothetical protein
MNIKDITPEMITAQLANIKDPVMRQHARKMLLEAFRAMAAIGPDTGKKGMSMVLAADAYERGGMAFGFGSPETIIGMVVQLLATCIPDVKQRTLLVGHMLGYMVEEGLIELDMEAFVPKDGIVN